MIQESGTLDGTSDNYTFKAIKSYKQTVSAEIKYVIENSTEQTKSVTIDLANNSKVDPITN